MARAKASLMKINFYLAARLADINLASSLIARISSIESYACTYDWTLSGSLIGADPQKLAEVAEAESDGVRRSDVLFFLSPGARGSHVEFGIAVAKRIPIVILYREEEKSSRPSSVFYHLPQVSAHRLGSDVENDSFFMTLAGELQWAERLRQS